MSHCTECLRVMDDCEASEWYICRKCRRRLVEQRALCKQDAHELLRSFRVRRYTDNDGKPVRPNTTLSEYMRYIEEYDT
jgi:hypothetical protein